MRSMQLLDGLEFHPEHPYAQPLFVDRHGRVLRFTMNPGQRIEEHDVPDSPFYVVILEGKGAFAGKDEQEKTFGPGSLLVFDPGEPHRVRALDEELVFIGFLHGAPSNVSDRVGGVMGHDEA